MLTGCIPWPDEVAKVYRQRGLWRGDRLGDLLRRDPGATALVTADGRHTYGELSARADRLAAGLKALGIERLDRVLVQLPNTADFVTTCVGLFRLGALPVLAMPGLRLAELRHLAESTEAQLAILPEVWQGFDHRELGRDLVKAVPTLRTVVIAGVAEEFVPLSAVDAPATDLPTVDPAEVAFFLLSGGTTRLPKLIPRTHDDYAYQMRATASAVGLDSSSAYVAALPVAHNAALGCPGILGAFQAGATVLMARSPSPDAVFPLLAAAGNHPLLVTTLMPALVPLWRESAAAYQADLGRLVVEVGGSVIDVDALRAFETETGCRVTRWFGMAEGPLSFTRPHDPAADRLANEGYPLSLEDEYAVVGEDGRTLPPGAVGELLVRGPTTLRGYYREPEFNAARFTADGFLRTGDLASIDIEGLLTIRGRTGDVVNRGGEKVPAVLVESRLAEHPAVKMCAVTGVPDPVLTEKVAAFVVPEGTPPTLADLVAFLRAAGIAPHCFPEHLVILDRLPTTAVGKVDKKALLRDT
ncbi:(2,3-dihydroxybenzoyl)adenylate synthase [Plantactinospora sp. WMMC1484]|uniref:(2,3-dihydroxybenzoyl)adenylate synthase n=1 Tax=Plantactinospora sp. WMMC1484 TaxID=3404122 RepID=UPI003BF57B53